MAAPDQPAAATSSSYAAALSSNIIAKDPYNDLMARFKSSVTVMQQSSRQTLPLVPDTGNYYGKIDKCCLDFFFNVVTTTHTHTFIEYLKSSWARDPETTLKLICNLRGVRGTGKSNREGFYTAALWLHAWHPATLACNLEAIAEFGYFKDFPEILKRILEGRDSCTTNTRGLIMYVRKQKMVRRFGRRWRPFMNINLGYTRRFLRESRREKKARSTPNIVASREERVFMAEQKNRAAAAEARERRHEKRHTAANNVLHLLSSDQNFRFLYDSVTSLFSECLKSDIKNLNSGNINKISLAAKWCPSLNSSYDRTTLLCESIAREIFPKESDLEYKSIHDAHYAYRVRDRLRKEILVPLRKALKLPEVYIGVKSWGTIPYDRVTSGAMKLYKDKFLKHDKERFEEYLGKVENGEAKIAAGSLLPHKIIQGLDDADGGRMAEVQWKRMVDEMAREGNLRNCLAVCDVSWKMEGIPMAVSIALGLLVSELSDKPWKGKIMTYSREPTLQTIKGKTLKNKVKFVRRLDTEGCTNFEKVFDIILKVALKAKLKPDQMVKKVFFFGPRMHKRCTSYNRVMNSWETVYRAIGRKFFSNGYGGAMPEIVFWNLKPRSEHVLAEDPKVVTFINGYSKNLMKMLLNEDRVIHGEIIMRAAISGKEYQRLVVYD